MDELIQIGTWVGEEAAPVPEPQRVPVVPFFHHPGDPDPEDLLDWEQRGARITSAAGAVVFAQEGVLFPASWSQTATNIVASKYFRVIDGVREHSVAQMVGRVVGTLASWGYWDGYLSKEDSVQFGHELAYLLFNQYASFNSPVWFNVGVPGSSNQSSACFLLAVEDSMASITQWYTDESKIFKGGSGAGVNISALRAEGEPLSLGGQASGPLSWMKVADTSAGAIKSGGVTRRAAKMVMMDCDHPDITQFIWSKIHEETKARILMQAGYSRAIDGEAYGSVAYQNANHSVRVSDAFMQAVEAGGTWDTTYRTSQQAAWTVKAQYLFNQIAQAAWTAGDPGIMFSDTVSRWHTCPASGPITTSNPCGEYVFLDNTACNLASLNLLKFLTPAGSFDVRAFTHAVDTLILAQEILVSRSTYPTAAIKQNSEDFRTLGLGFANLGALLMSMGLPYDSNEGRDLAAAVTALMSGQAYRRSTEIARVMGPFPGYPANREAMLGVIERHSQACTDTRHTDLVWSRSWNYLWDAASLSWKQASDWGHLDGFRNAQVTLLAPTGTISFMMDCTTTGVEPDVALVSYKKLVGGGTLKHVNDIVPRALQALAYDAQDCADLVEHVKNYGTLEGSLLHDRDQAVFDCAFPARPGGRAIAWQGHVKMVAALQPFLSGAISKTINLPAESTIQDVASAFRLAWELGCKSIAVYRDGCKETQVLTTQPDEPAASPAPLTREPVRRRLPDERQAFTHKFAIGGVHEGYLTVGLYEDGSPGEIFLKMAKEGSTLSGFADGFAIMVSLALQYGVPLEALVQKFSWAHFEPAGWTGHPDLKYAHSILDYVFRYLELKFLGTPATSLRSAQETAQDGPGATFSLKQGVDTPPCWQCGSLMIRNGSCLICPQCGSNTGCSG